jgi:methionyl-tRNA formyltransferase
MNIIFAASPEIAAPSLLELARLQLESNGAFCKLAAVITNPDSAKGRQQASTPTPVGAAAEKIAEDFMQAGMAPPLILKPEHFDESFCAAISRLKPDLLISFAFGMIFKKTFLDLFPLGGVNIHPSLLPKYRGATPIPAAILHGDAETGITFQKIALALDSGDILLQEKMALGATETTETLSNAVAKKSAAMLQTFLASHSDLASRAIPQDNGQATYCGLIKKEDGRIAWQKSAAEIGAQIRAYTPWPLSWTLAGGQTLYILDASPLDADSVELRDLTMPTASAADILSAAPGTVLGSGKKSGILIKTGKGAGSGALAVRRLQFATRKANDHQAFLNGAKDFLGQILG